MADYDGPPSRELTPALLRASKVWPILVVRTGVAAEVWWADSKTGKAHGPALAERGELNLVVFPGKGALCTGDGPRHGIEVAEGETVSCSLGPAGLALDRRESR